MEMHTIHTKALSRFFQILDGNFPSGAFIHSFGLEPHIVLERVRNRDELKLFLENLIIDQYQKLDFPFVNKIYRYLEQNRLDLIVREDNIFSAMQSYQYAKASKDIGENYLRQINSDIRKSIVRDYFIKVKNGESDGNELAILSAYSYELDISLETFLTLWSKKSILNIAMSSLKISRIKPSEIQKMLFEFDEVIDNFINSRENSVINFNPLFEEIIYQHRDLEPKLFVT
jgi:urease accessory protein